MEEQHEGKSRSAKQKGDETSDADLLKAELPPPEESFPVLVDRVRAILNIQDPREAELTGMGRGLGRDPASIRREAKSKGPSIDLPIDEALNALIIDTDNKITRVGEGQYLQEGHFIQSPPSSRKWYKTRDPYFSQAPQALPGVITTIQRDTAKPKPGAQVAQNDLIRWEATQRDNVALVNFISHFQRAQEVNLNRIGGYRADGNYDERNDTRYHTDK